MPLIGMISAKKDIREIKKNLKEEKIVEITSDSILNLKNIRFNDIIFNKDIKLNEQEYRCMCEIMNSADYILVNADINITILEKVDLIKPVKIITYGFNPKATISISSVKDDYIIASIQRKIEKINTEEIEAQEKKIEILKEEKSKVHIKLVNFLLKELHNL